MKIETGKHILSKSTLMMGLQCPKRLYLHKRYPELRDDVTEKQQEIFASGTEVGLLARQLFPGGTDASPATPFMYQASVKETAGCIERGGKVIYEAAFQYDGVLVALDILVNENGRWIAYEVKSSTSVSESNIHDASIQYWVITNAGLPIDAINIVHINNEYVRHGKIEVRELFTIQNITGEVINLQAAIADKISSLKAVALSETIPDIDIGMHCSDPYECDFQGYCWKHIPDFSIFEIGRLKYTKKFELYRDGIIRIDELPEDYSLSHYQSLQVDCQKANKRYIDRDAIKAFLETLSYPLYYMDFETFMPAVPLYDESRPYQQIVFQYSLHYLPERGGRLHHSEFLAHAGKDPRADFICRLLDDTSHPGDILVYNKTFEATRLRELALLFPEHALEIEKRIIRIKDLMIPFQKGYIYDPAMRGSYSIKAVLPALIPELSYDNLGISNGGMAMSAFEQLQNETDIAVSDKTRKDLLEYCKMDTLAMVRLLQHIENLFQ